MKKFAVLLYIPVLFSCRPERNPGQEVLALKEMKDLATVEYVVTKIIKASDDETWYKIGDRKILMSCQATLKAGIDFSSLNEGNFTVDGETVTVELPRAKLLSLNIRPEDVKVEYEEVGLLRKEFDNAERDALLAQGEAQIRNSVDSLGLLQTAETNASVFVTRFLQQMGYKNVYIRFGKTVPGEGLN